MTKLSSMFALIIFLLLPSMVFSQWTEKWSSSDIDATYAAGWVAFQNSGDNWINKFYIVTGTSFSIMDNEFSENATYSYNFTEAEQLAGNQIYSLGVDLTGDDIVEFYVLSYYGTSDNYRSSFKIIDIVTGSTVFEMDSPNFSYSYPVIWDVDNDGTWDCSFSQYDYPNYATFSYKVYNTGVPTVVDKIDSVPLNFKLNQNYPNPFGKGTSGSFATTIPYSLSKSGNVSIKIYDISGKLIKKLFSGFKTPGDYNIVWNGQDAKGSRVASGTYFYQLESNGQRFIRKMIILK